MDRAVGGAQIVREKQTFVDFCGQLLLEDLAPQSVAMVNTRGPKLRESSELRLPSADNVASLVCMRSRGDLNCDCITTSVVDTPHVSVNPVDWLQSSLNYFYADPSTVRANEQVLRDAFSHAQVLREMGTTLYPIDERVSQELKEILDTKITVQILGEEKTVTYKAFYHALAEQGEEPVLVLKSHRMIARILFPESQLSKQPLNKVMNDLDLLLSISLGIQPAKSEPLEKTCLSQGLAKLFGVDKRNAMVFCVQPTLDERGCVTGFGKPIPPNSYKIALSLSDDLKEDGYFPPLLRMDCVVKNKTVQPDFQQRSNNDIDVPGSMSVSYGFNTKIDTEEEWQPVTVNFSCHPLNYFWFSGDEMQQGRLVLCPDISGRDHRLNYLLDRSVLRNGRTGKPLRAQGRWLDDCNLQGKNWQSEWSYTLYKKDADSDAQNEQKKHPTLQFIDIDSLTQELESLSNVLAVWCKEHGRVEANKAFEERLAHLYVACHTYFHDANLLAINKTKMPELHRWFKICTNTLFQSQIKSVYDEKKKIAMYEAWLKKDRINCIKICWEAWLPALFLGSSKMLKNWLERNNLVFITQLIIIKKSLDEYIEINKIENIEIILKELRLLIFFVNGYDDLKYNTFEEVNICEEQGILPGELYRNEADERKQVLMEYVKKYVARYCVNIQDSQEKLIEQAESIFDRRQRVEKMSKNPYARLEKLVEFGCATDDEVSTLSQYMISKIKNSLKKKAATQAYVQYKKWRTLAYKLNSAKTSEAKLIVKFLQFFEIWAEGKKKDISDTCLEKAELILQLMEWAVETVHEKHIEQFWRREYHCLTDRLTQMRFDSLECCWKHMGGLYSYVEKKLQSARPILPEGLASFFKDLQPREPAESDLLAYNEEVQNALCYINSSISLIEKKIQYQSCEKVKINQDFNTLNFDDRKVFLKNLIDEHEKLHLLKKDYEKINYLIKDLKEMGFIKNQVVWKYQDRLDCLHKQAEDFVKYHDPNWKEDKTLLYSNLVRLMMYFEMEERYTSFLLRSNMNTQEKIEILKEEIGKVEDMENKKEEKCLCCYDKSLLSRMYLSLIDLSYQKSYDNLKETYKKLDGVTHKETGWLSLADAAIKSRSLTAINDVLDEYPKVFPDENFSCFYPKYLALRYEKVILAVKQMSEKMKQDDVFVLKKSIEQPVEIMRALDGYRDPTLLNKLFYDCQEAIFQNKDLLSAFLSLDRSDSKDLDTVAKILEKNIRKTNRNPALLNSKYIHSIFDFFDNLIKVKKVPVDRVKDFISIFIEMLIKKHALPKKKQDLIPGVLSMLLNQWCKYHQNSEKPPEKLPQLIQRWMQAMESIQLKMRDKNIQMEEKNRLRVMGDEYLIDSPCVAAYCFRKSAVSHNLFLAFLNIMWLHFYFTGAEEFPRFELPIGNSFKIVLGKINEVQKDSDYIDSLCEYKASIDFLPILKKHLYKLRGDTWGGRFDLIKHSFFYDVNFPRIRRIVIGMILIAFFIQVVLTKWRPFS